MNYLDYEAWLHPKIEVVCRQTLALGLKMEYKNLQEYNRESKNFWERNFGFIPFEPTEQAHLDVCVDSMGLVAFNLLLPVREGRSGSEALAMALLINLNRGFFQAGAFKNNPDQVPFDLRRLARGMYFLGTPLDKLALFGVSRHDEMEWVRPRREAWLSLWHLRPDGVE